MVGGGRRRGVGRPDGVRPTYGRRSSTRHGSRSAHVVHVAHTSARVFDIIHTHCAPPPPTTSGPRRDRFLKDKTANKGPKHVTPSSRARRLHAGQFFFFKFSNSTVKVANHNHHHHDLRSVAAAAAVAYPDARPNDYLGYCDPAAVNLWRMVVPRGGGPAHHPESVAPHQPPTTTAATAEPPHWGYGPWSSMPAPPPTSRHHHQGVKRHFNESDDCDDAFSEESSKDQ